VSALRGAGDAAVLARRNLSHIRQTPEKLMDVTIQPLMFVLLFAYVFGGAIHIPGGSYNDYLVGGIMVQTLTFGIFGPATSLSTDLREGILDRFRSLPIARSSFLVGHLASAAVSLSLALVVMVVSGLIVGWTIESDPAEALGGFVLLAIFSLTMLWLAMVIGLLARSPDTVTGIAFIIVFPLTFVANTFVPAATLPPLLRTVAEYNPISAVAAAVRTLFGNPTAIPPGAPWPLQHPVVASLIWCAIGLGVFIPTAIWLYRLRTTG